MPDHPSPPFHGDAEYTLNQAREALAKAQAQMKVPPSPPAGSSSTRPSDAAHTDARR